jgi:hypothetical protein
MSAMYSYRQTSSVSTLEMLTESIKLIQQLILLLRDSCWYRPVAPGDVHLSCLPKTFT